MSDTRMPEEMIAWMIQKGWGAHHDQWHAERKWDFLHAQAALPVPPRGVVAEINRINSKQWQRAPIQDGESGNGEDFLFMHRAMLHLLLAAFPQHSHYLRGWETPPQATADLADPVPPDLINPGNPVKGAFDPEMARAITRIEALNSEFADDDAFGLFVETKWRPVPGDPLRSSSDLGAGLHNYLHNRFADPGSPINMGSPQVNIFNQRFWRLHGWIDYQWWRFRIGKKLNDADAAYVTKLAYYVDMMNGRGHHHEHFAAVLQANSDLGRATHFMFD